MPGRGDVPVRIVPEVDRVLPLQRVGRLVEVAQLGVEQRPMGPDSGEPPVPLARGHALGELAEPALHEAEREPLGGEDERRIRGTDAPGEIKRPHQLAVRRIEVAVDRLDGRPVTGHPDEWLWLAHACRVGLEAGEVRFHARTVADLERHLDGVVPRTEPEQIVIEALGEFDELGHVTGALGDRDDVGNCHLPAGEDPRQRALVPGTARQLQCVVAQAAAVVESRSDAQLHRQAAQQLGVVHQVVRRDHRQRCPQHLDAVGVEPVRVGERAPSVGQRGLHE